MHRLKAAGIPLCLTSLSPFSLLLPCVVTYLHTRLTYTHYPLFAPFLLHSPTYLHYHHFVHYVLPCMPGLFVSVLPLLFYLCLVPACHASSAIYLLCGRASSVIAEGYRHSTTTTFGFLVPSRTCAFLFTLSPYNTSFVPQILPGMDQSSEDCFGKDGICLPGWCFRRAPYSYTA